MDLSVETIEKLEELLKELNTLISRFEPDRYMSKQHMIDRLDKIIEKWSNKYDLHV
jgi:hypothetical protein